jgi:hypothetical protein
MGNHTPLGGSKRGSRPYAIIRFRSWQRRLDPEASFGPNALIGSLSRRQLIDAPIVNQPRLCLVFSLSFF